MMRAVLTRYARGVALGIACVVLCVVAALPLVAQPSLTLRWQWQIADGLPQSTVTELTVDGAGAVWAATYGGLIRFDGSRIESFGLDRLPVLRSNRVSALALSRDGTMWMGTPEGAVVRLRDERIIDSLPLSPAGVRIVDALAETIDRTLWTRIGETVLTWRRGAWRSIYEARPHMYVNAPLVPLPDATVLTVDRDTLLRLSATGAAQRVLLPGLSEPDDAVISALLRDASGRLWVGTTSGLYVSEAPFSFSPVSSSAPQPVPRTSGTTRVTAPSSAPITTVPITVPITVPVQRVFAGRNYVTALQSGADGSILVTTRSSLLHVDTNTRQVESIAVPSGAEGLSSLAVTHDGAVLVGTFGQGMLVYSPSAVQHMTRADGLFTTEIFAVASDNNGGAYLGSDCTPILRISRDAKARNANARDVHGFRVQDTIRLDGGRTVCVRSLLTDARGALWVGTPTVLLRRASNGVERRWEIPQLAVGEDVRTLLAAGELLFAGTTDGRILVVGPDDQLRELPGWGAITGERITALAMAPDGALWVGMSNGVVVRASAGGLEGGTAAGTAAGRTAVRRFSRAEGIPAGEIRALYPDASGHVWVGSYGDGLARIEPDLTVRRWRLPDVTVSWFIPDDGRLWMLGNRGVSIVRRQQLEEDPGGRIVPAQLLSEPDGVYEGNAGFPAAARLDRRYFAFSSVNGVSIVDGDRLSRTARPASLVVRQLSNDRGPIAMGDTITLTPTLRTVSLSLSGPSYLDTDWLRFRYRVDGRDDDWIYLGEQRDITLAALPPKTVTFRAAVQATDGGWVETKPLVLRVVPRWYESVIARVLMALVVVTGVLTAVRWQVNLVQERAIALEQQMEERRALAEATERHQRELAAVGRVALAGEMSASLAHELGQPLSAIMNDAEVAKRLLARGAEPTALKPVIDHLVAQSERARSVIRALRGFLSPEGSEVSLSGGGSADAGVEPGADGRRASRRTQKIAVRTLLSAAEGLVRQEYRDAGIALEIEQWEPNLSVRGERVLLEQILVNLLTNAADAVRGRPVRRVGVRARRTGGGVRITVIDSGPGVPHGERERVFEPFVSVKPRGMGMGLTIVRRLVEGHEGRIAVRRGPYGGAAFSVVLPRDGSR